MHLALRAASLLVAIATIACAPKSRGNFKLLSTRVVPNQYAAVFYPRMKSKTCFGLLADEEDILQRGLEDALAKKPEANALALAEFSLDLHGCLLVEGTPVKLK